MRGLVTLTTDFGRRDPYVAAMKGVILGVCADARVLDLTHEIAPQDIREGARFIAAALPYFPAGAVHAVVIDPGVGTERRPLAVAAGEQIVVCPDNGLLTLLAREHPVEEARVISNPAFMRADVSATFHGRDVFVPAAARLACGAPLAEAGPALDVDSLTRLEMPWPLVERGRVAGEIVHIDRYGNAVSNVSRSLLDEGSVTAVRAGGRAFAEIHRTYADVAPGEPLVYFESGGYLAVAVNGGSASTVLGLREGDAVEVLLDR